jgi:hypothetical protein
MPFVVGIQEGNPIASRSGYPCIPSGTDAAFVDSNVADWLWFILKGFLRVIRRTVVNNNDLRRRKCLVLNAPDRVNKLRDAVVGGNDNANRSHG